LLEAIRLRYRESWKTNKTRILDEFVALTGYHRKYGIRLLSQPCDSGDKTVQDGPIRSRRVYDEAVKEALIVMWEASDRICGKRLKAIIPELLGAMERHGHMSLDPEVRRRVLQVSAATIDRLLKPVHSGAQSRRKRRRSKKVSKEIPVRTFADWGQPSPGYLETDLVAHCGMSTIGSFIHTLVATDVCSCWTELVPLMAREQSVVVEGFEVLFVQMPFPVLGVDSDNDSAFINDTLLAFSRKNQVEFTRSRSYHKNDQVDDEIKARLKSQREQIDPIRLLHRIRDGQAALAALASTDEARQGPGRESLDQFLAQLPRLWQAGEVRPTHRAQSTKPRYWRTRKDPFETVWYEVLRWLQESPEITAKELFEHLQYDYPGRFADGQLRTLQRRVRQWRQVMARKLVYACVDERAEG